MALYCTQAQFEANTEGWVTDNAATLERILVRAQRDVDRVLGPWPRREDTGLKLDPATDLTVEQRAALARAVAVQAHYRILKGEGLATPDRIAKKVSGPDFAIEYADAPNGVQSPSSGLLSPLLAAELAPLAWLRPVGARAHA